MQDKTFPIKVAAKAQIIYQPLTLTINCVPIFAQSHVGWLRNHDKTSSLNFSVLIRSISLILQHLLHVSCRGPPRKLSSTKVHFPGGAISCREVGLGACQNKIAFLAPKCNLQNWRNSTYKI